MKSPAEVAEAIWNMPVELCDDQVAARIDTIALRAAVEIWREQGGSFDALTSLMAGLLHASLRLGAPFRQETSNADAFGADLGASAANMLRILARIGEIGWQAAADELEAADADAGGAEAAERQRRH